jgi:predicted ATPase
MQREEHLFVNGGHVIVPIIDLSQRDETGCGRIESLQQYKTRNLERGNQMLTNFAFANYRAFRRGNVYVKPLTIVVGANSVGKTALLQVPLLIKQTALLGETKLRGALRIHGRDVSFGQPRQLYHNLDTNNDLEFEFGFKSDRLLKQLSGDIVDEFVSTFVAYCQYLYIVSTQAKLSPRDTVSAKYFSASRRALEGVVNNNQRRSSRLNNLSALLELQENIESIAFIAKWAETDEGALKLYPAIADRGSAVSARGRFRSPISSFSEVDLRRAIHYCTAIRQLTSEDFSVRFSVGLSEKLGQDGQAGTLYVKSIHVKSRDKIIFGMSLNETSVVSVYSQIIDQNFIDHKALALSASTNQGGSIFSLFSENPATATLSNSAGVVRSVFSACIAELYLHVGGTAIEHIGPLRAHPKRFYFLDQNYSLQSGESVVEKLREDHELVARVNSWLKTFRVTISVSQLVEIISRLSIRSESASFDLDITDVGFGISQILPIIVEGLLAPPGRTLIVEQPEIHLHPKMQAELADFLIDVANIRKSKSQDETSKYERTIIVETHSEYLMNRIRRRISEGEVSHSDVAIYFVEAGEGRKASATVRGINIPANGDFEWPRDFYENDLNDALAFFKNAAQGHLK